MMPSEKVLKKLLIKLINKGDKKNLEKVLKKFYEGTIAVIFRHLSHEERIKLFKTLVDVDVLKASNVLYDLDEDIQIEILRNLDTDIAVLVLLKFSPGEIARILNKLPKNLRIALYSKLSEDFKKELEDFIKLGEDSIAPLISEDYIAVREDKLVSEALNLVRTAPKDIEVIYIYIVDDNQHLVGVISVRELLTAPENVLVKDISIPSTEIIKINKKATKEEAIEIFQKYDLFVLPVVDDENKLIGVIYIDDILDAITEKTSEDILKLAGSHEEEVFFHTGNILKVMKLRLFSFVIATAGELGASFIIIFFSKLVISDLTNNQSVKDLIILLSFMPLLAAMTGNISSQASILTTRGIITGRLKENIRDFISFLKREIKIAFIFATLTAILVSLIAFATHPHHILSVIIGLALFINMILASLFGTLFPFIAYKIKKDPTIATNPIILTLNDIFSIIIYFSIAYLFLKVLKF